MKIPFLLSSNSDSYQYFLKQNINIAITKSKINEEQSEWNGHANDFLVFYYYWRRLSEVVKCSYTARNNLKQRLF